jgi:hypothetical protein
MNGSDVSSERSRPCQEECGINWVPDPRPGRPAWILIPVLNCQAESKREVTEKNCELLPSGHWILFYVAFQKMPPRIAFVPHSNKKGRVVQGKPVGWVTFPVSQVGTCENCVTPWNKVLIEELICSFLSSKEITCLLCSSKVHFRVHNSPKVVPILSHMNPVHIPHPISLRSILILSAHVLLC